jgi:hypothetical protein
MSGHLLSFIVSKNMDHGQSFKGRGDSSVTSPVHSPSALEFTGRREIFTAFHCKLCRDHKRVHAFTKEGRSFTLG